MASGLLMAALVASIWAIGNGVLHDAFVLARHEGPYTRELLRLLMDGHILITCGVPLGSPGATNMIRIAHVDANGAPMAETS